MVKDLEPLSVMGGGPKDAWIDEVSLGPVKFHPSLVLEKFERIMIKENFLSHT